MSLFLGLFLLSLCFYFVVFFVVSSFVYFLLHGFVPCRLLFSACSFFLMAFLGVGVGVEVGVDVVLVLALLQRGSDGFVCSPSGS